MTQESSDDKLLVSRAGDALKIAEKRYSVKTLGFLNPHQRVVISRNVLPESGMSVIFDGGYDEAERTMLVCFPEYIIPERGEYMALLECTGRDIGRLSHRDYLGSLMGLGIVRENIGDILVLDDRTLIVVKRSSAEYILLNLKKIGSCGVNIRECSFDETQIPDRPTKELSGTVSALRLDSIISMALGVSRAKSAELIRGGLVTVNWEPAEEVSLVLNENDVLSVRGYGRMKLSKIGGTTRKGRISVVVSRYI